MINFSLLTREILLMGRYIYQVFSQFILLITLTLTIFLGSELIINSHAVAAISQLEEAPGQIVYQARQTLKDRHGNSWQAIAFKRVPPNGKATFELRLVGFPGVTVIDRTKPLVLTDSMGKMLTANDTSSTIFTDLASPEPNVGQYNLQPLLAQLQAEIPLELTIAAIDSEAINLSVPPSFVEEWQTIFTSKE